MAEVLFWMEYTGVSAHTVTHAKLLKRSQEMDDLRYCECNMINSNRRQGHFNDSRQEPFALIASC